MYALKASSELKPGEYSFQKNASLRDVIGTIVEGKVVQHAVTIPEGLTSEQIVARLSDNDIFAGTVREIAAEGTLLPETYKFPRGTTREQVIQRMQQTQKRVLAEIWERRNPDIPVKSPEQLVTLASIVEKETGRADERSRVAAVFTNRLRQKIKLQSDPTIIYGLVGGKGTLGRPIKRSEIAAAVALQHLCDRGPAAGADRQSRPCLARSRRQPGAHARPVLRRRRHRRAHLHRNLRRASEERRKTARDGKADPERYRRAGRGRAAAAAGRRRRPTPTRPRPPAARCAKKPPRGLRPAAPPAPARQGAVQSTTSPPVVQR